MHIFTQFPDKEHEQTNYEYLSASSYTGVINFAVSKYQYSIKRKLIQYSSYRHLHFCQICFNRLMSITSQF